MPYFFVGDSAFPLATYMMKPFPIDVGDRQRTVYNYRLCRGRRVIENVFGIMSAKWRVLLTCIGTSPQVADKIVKACCALHNFLIDESPRGNAGNPTTMADRDGEDGAWRAVVGQGLAPVAGGRRHNRAPNDALAQRLDLVHYFSNEGALDWQDEHIGFNE